MSAGKLLCAAAAFGFLLGIHDGKAALWKDEDPEPLKIFPWKIKALPDKIREPLENGIYFSEEDLPDFLR